MKKLFTVVFTMLLAGSLAFAQGTGGSTDASKAPAGGKKTTTSAKKATKKAHKGGKKSKKGSAPATTAPAPK